MCVTPAGSAMPAPTGAAATATAGGGPLQSTVQQLAATLQQLTAALGGGASAGVGGEVTSGAPGVRMPGNGAELADQLERMAIDRASRTSALVGSLAGGGASAVDAQRVAQFQRTTEHVQRLAYRVRELAPTIDATEAAQVMQVVQQAEATGRIDAVALSRAMVQLVGSSQGATPAYLAAANRVIDTIAAHMVQQRSLEAQVAASAERTGAVNQVDVARLQAMSAELGETWSAEKLALDSYARDPQQAEQRMAAAAGQSTLQGIRSALGH